VSPSGEHTDFNALGPEISDADYLRLIDRIKLYLDPSNLFVLSGRMPPGMSEKQYLKLIRIIKKKGCPLFLDCSGQLLNRVLDTEYKPDFIKPNSTELAQATGRPKTKDPEKAYIGAKELLDRGVKFVCASLGDNGALFLAEKQTPLYITSTLNHRRSSAVGSGDAMIGAIAHAYNQGMCFEEMAKFAVAMGTASAQLPGSQMATMKEAFEVYETLQVYTM
ncbi:MAG: 1-phosphofructokinase family hexose kinase, partial [Butyricicoccaceae bacterium]